jgi:RNA polymerase sigma-70 factor, ECF subfamily
MAAPSTESVTRLLEEANAGDPRAVNRLFPLVYEELRAIAARSLRAERPSHTLQPTALVHEAYLRLVGERGSWNNRAHFLAIAAQAMRRILVDYARAHRASKRGAACRVALDDAPDASAAESPDLAEVVEVHEAMSELAVRDPALANVVELRYFGGLTIDETAAALARSPATIKRDWHVARAWLHRRLSEGRTRG